MSSVKSLMPSYVKNTSIGLYFFCLIVVSVLYFEFKLEILWVIFGITWILLFFNNAYSKSAVWQKYSESVFIKKLFTTAFLIRIVYVIFTYFLYQIMTDSPMEFNAADSWAYHGDAAWLSQLIRDGYGIMPFVDYKGDNISDFGYPFYLGLVYSITDDSIIIVRLLKALYSACTCVLIYKIGKRNFGENVGRMAGILCAFMPNLIFYCGVHLKETEMLFLTCLYAERADFIINSRTYKPQNVIIAIACCASLFTLRTALGGVAILAFLTALVFTSSKVMGWQKKILIGSWFAICIVFFAGNKISNELESMVKTDVSQTQDNNMKWRAERKGGNSFAVYAGKSVFAPLIFTIPFPTMVDIEGQELQMMIHGGNFVKNITSFFTIFALIILVFKKRTWRQHVFPIAIMCGYLMVIALSVFAHSERFHLPSVPFALLFAAYGMSMVTNKTRKYFTAWSIFIFVAILGWSWFKLAGRGLL